jgi:1-acyl-sn-glycerol-3-phosphate acyltransferase
MELREGALPGAGDLAGARRPRGRARAAALLRHLRAGRRAVLLVLLSLGLVAPRLAGRTLAVVSPRAGRALGRAATRAWARLAARVLGMRVRVEGEPPRTPHLLVSNHLSYVDVVALWSAASGLFVAKSEVSGWPLVGTLGRAAGTLFIDRQRKRDILRVLVEMEAALCQGESVILFPEGTSTPGDAVLPFKSSLFEASVRAGVPVGCASVAYRTPAGDRPAHLAVCWWGDMTFGDHAWDLLGLPRFEAVVRFAPDALGGSDRKRLARRAHAEVTARFEPVVGAA